MKPPIKLMWMLRCNQRFCYQYEATTRTSEITALQTDIDQNESDADVAIAAEAATARAAEQANADAAAEAATARAAEQTNADAITAHKATLTKMNLMRIQLSLACRIN